MISKRKIKLRSKKKQNPEISRALSLAIKNKEWKTVSQILSGPTRAYSSFNLSQLDKLAKDGDKVVVIGKILSSGELKKKIKICGLSISAQAVEKLKRSKSEFVKVETEIKANPKALGIKLLR